MKDRETFEINWYEKDSTSRCGKYISMRLDNGSLYVSELDVSSVMYWAFTERGDDKSFVITPYWHDCLMNEYEKIDRNE